MITFHPSVSKAHPRGFRSVVLLRSSSDGAEKRMQGSTIYPSSEEARTEARARAHNASRAILAELPHFPVRVT